MNPSEIKIIYDNDGDKIIAEGLKNIFSSFDKSKLDDIIESLKKTTLTIVIHNNKYTISDPLNTDFINKLIEQLYRKGIEKIKDDEADTAIQTTIISDLLDPNLNFKEYYKNLIKNIIPSSTSVPDPSQIIKLINDNLPNQIINNTDITGEIQRYKTGFIKIDDAKLSPLPSKDDRLIGISNKHDMCPLNTLIQMLKQIDEVYYYFTQITKTDDDFLQSLQFLFTNKDPNNDDIAKNQILIINRLHIKKQNIKLGIGNDLFDIFNAIIDIITIDLNTPHNFDNIINKLYHSFLLNLKYCNNTLEKLVSSVTRSIDIFVNIKNINKFFIDSENIKFISDDTFNCEGIRFEKSIYLVTDETKYIFVNISDQLKRPITIDKFIELYDETGKKVKFYPKSTAMHSEGHYVFATLENDNKQIVFNTIIDDENVIKKQLDNGSNNPDYHKTYYKRRKFYITDSPVLILYEREP
jgi:hypothetical protein